MLPPGLETPRQVKAYYEERYNAYIDSGQYLPFVYPWATLGAAVVIVYLLFDHRRSPTLQALRFPVFGTLVAFSAWTVVNVKARSAPAAYGVGLISAWGTLWTSSIMFFNDCQTDFKRLERADAHAFHQAITTAQETNDSTDHPISTAAAAAAATSRVKKQARKAALQASESYATQPPSRRTGPIFWQPYPTQPFISRLEWVLDVFCSFRGVGWTFQTTGIPKAPKDVELQLLGYDTDTSSASHPHSRPADSNTKTISHTGIIRFSSRKALSQHVFPRLILGVAALDVIKCLMHHDAYFWGYTDAGPPTWFPNNNHRGNNNNNNNNDNDNDNTHSPILLQTYRLLLSLCGISFALNTIFLLGPLFFCCLLGPERIGLRGEAHMNPVTFFGSPTLIFTQGLSGWWGGFWHQTFRFAFEAPGERLCAYLAAGRGGQEDEGTSSTTTTTKMAKTKGTTTIKLLIAFALSGCLHACGSWTQLGDTRPFRGPFCFFLCQAFGIVMQKFLTSVVQQSLSRVQLNIGKEGRKEGGGGGGRGQKIPLPSFIRQIGNLGFTLIWLYWTAPLLMEDFAQGGVWLYEPLVISPLRILGFGAQDDNGWDLWYGLVFWRSGKGWFDSGIAF